MGYGLDGEKVVSLMEMENIIDTEYKFSVLMSVYHKENPNYFKEALDSILVNQTLKADEFVLVVDGPVNDDLNIIINEYENNYKKILKVYKLEKNVGLGMALNYGLNKCTYNLVARADSDDINVPERFQFQIDKFKRNDLIDVLGTFIDEFDNDFSCPINYKKMPLEHNELYKMAKKRNPINHMSVMFKKKAIIEAGAYQHLPYLEDYFLWVRVISNGGKLENLDKYLVHVRVGNGMVYRRSNKEYIPGWKALNNYMKSKKIINSYEYIRNIINIYGFIYMPISLKKIGYKVLLRN